MIGGESSHLRALVEALVDQDIQFIICGGVAVNLQGVERSTLDLDISLQMNSENLSRFIELTKSLSLVPRAPVSAEVLLDKSSREKIIKEKNALVFTFIDTNNPYRQIDVFLTEDHAFEAFIDRADVFTIHGKKIPTLSKEQLIELKSKVKPERDKDNFDILQLKKLMNNNGK